MSLRLRLNLILSIVFVTTLAIGTTFLLTNVRRTVTEELLASVDHTARLVALVVSRLPTETSETAVESLISDIAGVGPTRHLQISIDSARGQSPALLERPGEAPAWFKALVSPEPLALIRVVDLRMSRKRVIIRADPNDEIDEAWREARPLMLMLLLFGLLANGLIYFVVGRSLRSLEDVSDALAGIEAGNYSIAVPKVGIADIDQIAERLKDLARALEQSNAEANALARKSLSIQEAERRELAQALHDELGQSISAIKALAVSVDRRAMDAGTNSDPSIRSIIEVSSEMYGRIRDMMSLLRPSVLDELGMRSALQNMVDDWNAYHEDTFCRLQIAAELPEVGETIAINCYRIVQEALTNIANHAQASDAEISIDVSPQHDSNDVLRLRISDNGRGFDSRTVIKGLGLLGIHERVNAMGGNIDLESDSSGTRYEITIPLD